MLIEACYVTFKVFLKVILELTELLDILKKHEGVLMIGK